MGSIEINGGKRPLIEPGEYEGVCTGHRTQLYRGQAPKLVLEFKLLRGPFVNGAAAWDSESNKNDFLAPKGYEHPDNVTVARYYNCLRKNPDGTLAAKRYSDLAEEYAIVTDKKPDPSRLDPDVFTGGRFRLQVETVTTRRGNTSRHRSMHYSKVGLLLSRCDNGECLHSN